jgi:excisionase family DNA binding protein
MPTSSVPKKRRPLPSGGTLYTVAEAAAIFGVSQRTVHKWISSGKLPHLRLGEDGRLIRIHSDDIETFISQTRQQSTPA